MLVRSMRGNRNVMSNIQLPFNPSVAFASATTIEDVYWDPSDHSVPWPLPDEAQNYTSASLISPGFQIAGHGTFDNSGSGTLNLATLTSAGAVIQSGFIGDSVGISTTYTTGAMQLFKASGKIVCGFRLLTTFGATAGSYTCTLRYPLTLVVTGFA